MSKKQIEYKYITWQYDILLSHNGGAGEQRPPGKACFGLVGDCSSRLLSGAEHQTTSGCSARAPVALDAQRPEQLFIQGTL